MNLNPKNLADFSSENHYLKFLRQKSLGFLKSSSVLQTFQAIGDDAALLNLKASAKYVVAKDLIADGVHFRSERHRSEDIGIKACLVNLSDLAAMGAQPLFALISLLLEKNSQNINLAKITAGLELSSSKFNFSIVGGDTNSWSHPSVVCVTLFGKCRYRPVPRINPKIRLGDKLFITGTLGKQVFSNSLLFAPRLYEGETLSRFSGVKAMMDLSDGLAADALKLVSETDLKAEIDLDLLPVDQLFAKKTLNLNYKDQMQRLVSYGEDFELLFIADKDFNTAKLPFRVFEIGKLARSKGVRSKVEFSSEKLRDSLEGENINGYEHSF